MKNEILESVFHIIIRELEYECPAATSAPSHIMAQASDVKLPTQFPEFQVTKETGIV